MTVAGAIYRRWRGREQAKEGHVSINNTYGGWAGMVVPRKEMCRIAHLILLTKDKKSISFHLGPEWFTDREAKAVRSGADAKKT